MRKKLTFSLARVNIKRLPAKSLPCESAIEMNCYFCLPLPFYWANSTRLDLQTSRVVCCKWAERNIPNIVLRLPFHWFARSKLAVGQPAGQPARCWNLSVWFGEIVQTQRENIMCVCVILLFLLLSCSQTVKSPSHTHTHTHQLLTITLFYLEILEMLMLPHSSGRIFGASKRPTSLPNIRQIVAFVFSWSLCVLLLQHTHTHTHKFDWPQHAKFKLPI